MGKHFGELAFIRGIVYYKLSPHEMKPMGGVLTQGLPNMIPRTMATLPRWLPQFLMGAFIYYYVEHVHHMNGRKNPKDYIDEINPNPPPPPPVPAKKTCE